MLKCKLTKVSECRTFLIVWISPYYHQAGYVSQRIRLFVLSVARRTAQHSGSCMDRAGVWRFGFWFTK